MKKHSENNDSSAGVAGVAGVFPTHTHRNGRDIFYDISIGTDPNNTRNTRNTRKPHTLATRAGAPALAARVSVRRTNSRKQEDPMTDLNKLHHAIHQVSGSMALRFNRATTDDLRQWAEALRSVAGEMEVAAEVRPSEQAKEAE